MIFDDARRLGREGLSRLFEHPCSSARIATHYEPLTTAELTEPAPRLSLLDGFGILPEGVPLGYITVIEVTSLYPILKFPCREFLRFLW
jgi:hypothetical protein